MIGMKSRRPTRRCHGSSKTMWRTKRQAATKATSNRISVVTLR